MILCFRLFPSLYICSEIDFKSKVISKQVSAEVHPNDEELTFQIQI